MRHQFLKIRSLAARRLRHRPESDEQRLLQWTEVVHLCGGISRFDACCDVLQVNKSGETMVCCSLSLHNSHQSTPIDGHLGLGELLEERRPRRDERIQG